MDRRVLLVMALAAVALAAVLVAVRWPRRHRETAERPDLRKVLEWGQSAPELAEADPLLDLPEPSVTGDVLPFRSQAREPVRSLKPLPVFPEGSSAALSALGRPEGGPLGGLYKDGDGDYLDGVSLRTQERSGKERYEAGVKE